MISLPQILRHLPPCERWLPTHMRVKAVLAQNPDSRRRLEDVSECTSLPCPAELLAFVLHDFTRLEEQRDLV